MALLSRSNCLGAVAGSTSCARMRAYSNTTCRLKSGCLNTAGPTKLAFSGDRSPDRRAKLTALWSEQPVYGSAKHSMLPAPARGSAGPAGEWPGTVWLRPCRGRLWGAQ
eukprot:2012972-Pyramimonas_sp.AAC.1